MLVHESIMNSSYRFKYNAFNTPFYMIAVTLVVGMMMFTGFYECIAYIIVVMGVFLLLCRRDYLIIDETGILKRKIFDSDEFMSWDDIGGYREKVIKGSGKSSVEGFAIIGKNVSEEQEEEDYDEDIHKIFIPKYYIIGSNEEINEALRSSIDYYVMQTGRTRRRNNAGWGDDPYPKWLPSVVGMLAIIGMVGLAIYAVTSYTGIVNGEYGDQVGNTLMNGEYFADSYGPIILFLLVFLALFFLPTYLLKKRHILYSLLLTLPAAYAVFFTYTVQPQAELLLQNCSQPTSAPVEVVKGEVTKLSNGKNSYTELTFIYDDYRYEVREKYLSKCRVGMPVLVSIQRGSKGIPIVRDILISDIGWTKQNGFLVPVTDSKRSEDLAGRKKTAAVKTGEEENRPKQSERAWRSVKRQPEYRWKISDTKEWQQQTLIVDGVDKGTWRTLESTSVDKFGTRKLGMVIAINESKKQVVLIICEEDSTGGYRCYDVDVEPTFSFWFDNDHEYFTLRRDPAAKATWMLGERDVPVFIRKIRHAYNITLTAYKKIGIRHSERKDFAFLVGKNEPGRSSRKR